MKLTFLSLAPLLLWYSPLVTVSESELLRNPDTFYQLKSALRYATANPEHHSEIPKLLQRVRLFALHPDHVIARKAFYEEFVAVLRGLNAAEHYEPKLLEYLSAIGELNEPSELEDAAILLSYTNGACDRGILQIETAIRIKLRDELLTKLNSLISPEPSFVNCSLLFAKGHLLLMSVVLQDVLVTSKEDAISRAAEDAVAVWSTLIKHSRQIPFFPVERLRSLVTFLFPLVISDKFTDFVKKFDVLTAERAGDQALAEQVVDRASGLLDAKQYLRSLHEFHEALRLSHSLESQSTAISVCLQLAMLYHHLRLFHAAKYYGLAGAYAALKLPEDDLRKFSAIGLAAAAEADYASGASLLFFLTCKAFIFIAHEYAIAGASSFRAEQWAKIDYHTFLLTRAAKIVDVNLYERCRELLKPLGADEMYRSTEKELEIMFKDLDVVALNKQFQKQGISAPFCDFAPIRKTLWKQFGVTWQVEWDSNYEAERYGETICAALQIVFTALAGTELSIIATEITIEVNTTHTGDAEIKQLPDNKILRFSVAVDPTKGMDMQDHLTLARIVLSVSSAIPKEDFKARFVDEFNRGLKGRIGVYISPAEVFRQFYGKEDYEKLHSEDSVQCPTDLLAVRTWEGISEVSTLHPAFDESEALEQISNRYRRIPEMFKYTLRQLSTNSAFLDHVSDLRSAGWKDWHILLAVGNVRVSSFLNAGSKYYEELADDIARNGERAEDPLTPVEFYNQERLKTSLEMSQVSTLRNLGFRMEQMTPNFKGIGAFLSRFKYWELDIPHQNPFQAL